MWTATGGVSGPTALTGRRTASGKRTRGEMRSRGERRRIWKRRRRGFKLVSFSPFLYVVLIFWACYTLFYLAILLVWIIKYLYTPLTLLKLLTHIITLKFLPTMVSRDKLRTKTPRANLQGDPAGFLLLYLKSQQDLTNRSLVFLPNVATCIKNRCQRKGSRHKVK